MAYKELLLEITMYKSSVHNNIMLFNIFFNLVYYDVALFMYVTSSFLCSLLWGGYVVVGKESLRGELVYVD